MAIRTAKEQITMLIAYDENGVSKQRQATEDEIAYIEAAQKEAQDVDVMLQNEADQKATAKAALLDKLGITAEEAKLLLS
jgi:hypothetical protein